MIRQMYRGQVVCPSGYNVIDFINMIKVLKVDFQISKDYYLVLNPFVQLNYLQYPPKVNNLQQKNLIQGISRDKFINCIYRDGAEDIDEGIYVSAKFGKRPVVLNAERTHCYFSSQGRFYKSKVWTDKLGAVYGACAGSQYGEYDGKL